MNVYTTTESPTGSPCSSCRKVSCSCPEFTYTLGTATSDSIYITDSSGGTITTTTSGTITVDSSGFIGGASIDWGYNKSINVGEYTVEDDDGELVIRDKNGNKCISFKDGVPMIGEKTLHQLILDIIEMYNGEKPLIDLLVDPDKGKRELGHEIHTRRRNREKNNPEKIGEDSEGNPIYE